MDCKQKSILVIKGINQYGVLSYMLEGIAAELQYRGYIVTVCNWDELDEWKKQKWDICISCQAINMTFEVQGKAISHRQSLSLRLRNWLRELPTLRVKRN